MSNLNQPAFLRVPVRCIPTIVDALRAAGFEQEAKNVEDFTDDYIDPAANEERMKWIKVAREQVAKDGEVEIDDDATISHSEGNGEYVLAWVWVDGDGDEKEDGEDEG